MTEFWRGVLTRRQHWFASSDGVSNTTSASDQTKLTLKFQPKANTNYLYVWTALVSAGSTTADVRVKLTDGAGTLAETNIENRHSTDVHAIGGIAFGEFGSSPAEETLTLAYSAESGNTVAVSQVRLLVLELLAVDSYDSSDGEQSTTSASAQTAVSTSWTPATEGSYLALFSQELNFAAVANGNSTHTWSSINSVGVGVADTTNWLAGFSFRLQRAAASSQSLLNRYHAGSTGEAFIRRARVAALRLEDVPHSHQEETGISDSTSTTYAARAAALGGGAPHVILASANFGAVDTSLPQARGRVTDSAGVKAGPSSNEPLNSSGANRVGFMFQDVKPLGRWALEWSTGVGGNTARITEARIVALQLDDAQADVGLFTQGPFSAQRGDQQMLAFPEPPEYDTSRNFTTDALLRKTFTKTHSTNALLLGAPSVGHGAFATLRDTFTLAHTADALIQVKNLKPHTTDASLSKTSVKTHSTDARLHIPPIKQHNTSAALRGVPTLAHTTGAVLRTQLTKSHTTGAYLRPLQWTPVEPPASDGWTRIG